MSNKLFSKESFAILKDRKLIIAIVAVMFVPILYAGMFLWAFWDPYAQLEDIPVAIVNEDAGYEFEGDMLTLGDELVDNLRDEAAFDFHFVNKADGLRGLQDEDYYILIEIPEDFSKNATTVMDDQPNQLSLIYQPNESYNFLASQMGETAMLQIEQALEEKITETFVETVFNKIDEVTDGLVDASDATTELDDGAKELQEGSGKLKENLLLLSEKSLEFTDGITTAQNGSSDVATGANQLDDGVSQLTDGSKQLLDASTAVQSGTKDLASGTNEVADGTAQLEQNIPLLIDGTNEIQAGVNQIQSELPKQMASKISAQILASSNDINSGIDELETGIVNGLTNGLAPQLSEGLVEGISTNFVKEVDPILQAMPNQIASGIAAELAPQILKQQTEQMENVVQIMQQIGISNEQITDFTQIIASNTPDQNALQESLTKEISQGIQENLPNTKTIVANIEPNLSKNIETGVYGAVNEVTTNIESGFTTFKTGINQGLEQSTANLETDIKTAVNPVFAELSKGLTKVNDGQKQLQTGAQQLAIGAKQLNSGSATLAAGQSQYVNSMTTFTEKLREANAGTSELALGTTELLNGLKQLVDGSQQLNDGSKQLADGSVELSDGMESLVDGTSEFNEKMHQAAEEASDVTATDNTINMFANPVEVENEKVNEVPNYGTGFAPYFLSLGLFVGALLLSIVYPLREPSVVPSSGTNWFFRKFIALFTIGIIQAIIAVIVLLVGLKIEVQSIPLFVLFAIITSLSFITLIQFLVTCLDDPGRFIAIIILILQLTTSAGTFPLELIPKVLQPINLLLPMTYSVAGFKAVISSGNFSTMWLNAGILIGFSLLFMALAWSYFAVMFKRKFATMQTKEA